MPVFRGHRLLLVSSLVLALLAVNIPAIGQVSRGELDEARRRRDEASARLDEVVTDYDQVYGELATVTFRLGEFEDRITSYESEIRELHDLVQAQAIAAFKAGNVTDVSVIFGVDSLTQLIIGRQFLESAAKQEVSHLDRLSSVRNGLEASRERLLEDQERFRDLEKEQGDLVEEIGSLFDALDTEFVELRTEFEEAERLRREEERRQRLTALALLEGAAAGASAAQTAGFVCPFNSLYRFVNDWSQPRSGGRAHKGTDIVAPFGQPVIAVASGSVLKRKSDLGGVSLWLDANNGTSYYYAHLSGYVDGLSEGGRVSAGQVVAYNGDSGNATGGVPHVHFQVHPGGRGNNPVNPYPTLVEHCS